MVYRIFLWIMVVFAMTVIFMFSHQPAEQSGRISGEISRTLTEVLPMIDETDARQMVSLESVLRNFAHFFLFAILGVTVTMLFDEYKWKWYAVMLFCILYAISDEVHQHFIPGRSPRLTDVLIDTAGSAFGCALTYGAKYIFRRKQKGNDV